MLLLNDRWFRFLELCLLLSSSQRAGHYSCPFSQLRPDLKTIALPKSVYVAMPKLFTLCNKFIWAASGSVDTDLSELRLLELYRTHVAQC